MAHLLQHRGQAQRWAPPPGRPARSRSACLPGDGRGCTNTEVQLRCRHATSRGSGGQHAIPQATAVPAWLPSAPRHGPTAPGLSPPRCPTCPPSCGQRWAARCRRPTHTCQGRGRGDRTPVTKDTAGQHQDTRPAPAAVLSLCDRQVLHPPVGLAALQWADFGEVKWRADLIRHERLPAARHLRACMGPAALGGSACMQVAHSDSRGSGHHSNLPHPAGPPASC